MWWKTNKTCCGVGMWKSTMYVNQDEAEAGADKIELRLLRTPAIFFSLSRWHGVLSLGEFSIETILVSG